MCNIGPKGKPRTFELRAILDPYIHEVIYMGWVQLSSLVKLKRHRTACAIGPKGKVKIFELHVTLDPYILEVIYMG